MNPVLGYSLPTFRRGGYERAREWLDKLASLGFRSVTFTPTYLVYDEQPPRLDLARGPGFDELHAAVQMAAASGFRVRMEPHLDFECTLTGGPYEWRNRMRLDPAGDYLDQILAPILSMGPASLTLGSELDVSLVEFAERWTEVARRLSGTARLGHKLNHDSLDARINAAERARRYLETLDWVSFSFYPALRRWTGTVTGAADEFERRIRRLHARLPEGSEMAIGEMGLGSADVSRPWHFDASTFASEGALRTRRVYYLGLLESLKRTGDLIGAEGAVFWSVTHFDFLGVLGQPGYEAFRDEELVDAVQLYNAQIET